MSKIKNLNNNWIVGTVFGVISIILVIVVVKDEPPIDGSSYLLSLIAGMTIHLSISAFSFFVSHSTVSRPEQGF